MLGHIDGGRDGEVRRLTASILSNSAAGRDAGGSTQQRRDEMGRSGRALAPAKHQAPRHRAVAVGTCAHPADACPRPASPSPVHGRGTSQPAVNRQRQLIPVSFTLLFLLGATDSRCIPFLVHRGRAVRWSGRSACHHLIPRAWRRTLFLAERSRCNPLGPAPLHMIV